MSEFIQTTVGDGHVEIRIARPERRNAITAEMYLAMARAIETIEADSSVGIILILGSDDVFTAGNDLADFVERPPSGPDSPVFRFMRALARSSKVIVAGVSGLAVGIGTTMLLHCDLVVSTRDARFMMPFSSLGLVPEFASSLLFPALVGRQRAARHLLLGDPMDAEEAFSYGFVSHLVDSGRVEEEARTIVARLLQLPPRALAKTKRLMARPAAEIEAVMALEAEQFGQCLRDDEFAEAAAAFFERRPPRFPRPAKD